MGYTGNIALDDGSYASGPYRTSQQGYPAVKRLTELVLEVNGHNVYIYHRKPLTPAGLAKVREFCEREVTSWSL